MRYLVSEALRFPDDLGMRTFTRFLLALIASFVLVLATAVPAQSAPVPAASGGTSCQFWSDTGKHYGLFRYHSFNGKCGGFLKGTKQMRVGVLCTPPNPATSNWGKGGWNWGPWVKAGKTSSTRCYTAHGFTIKSKSIQYRR